VKTAPKTPKTPPKRAPTGPGAKPTTPASATVKRPPKMKKEPTAKFSKSQPAKNLPEDNVGETTVPASYELTPPSSDSTTVPVVSPVPYRNEKVASPRAAGQAPTPETPTLALYVPDQQPPKPPPKKRVRRGKSQAPPNGIIDLTSEEERTDSSSSSSAATTVAEPSDSRASESETTAPSPTDDTGGEIKQEDESLPTRYRRQTRSYTAKKRKVTEMEIGVEDTNASLWDGGVIAWGGGERHLKFR
jgi:hypothetical protein